MNPKNFKEKLYGLVFLFSILLLTNQALAKNNDLSNGIWFICEFAHSQIPPEDDCNMLDDDGFQIINGIVHRIKIKNSIETRCRQNRVGNCFLRTRVGLVAERSEIGPIKLFAKKIYLTWLGCTQKYLTIQYPDYNEIFPSSEKCWWTSDKRYFVARYVNKIKIAPDN